VTVETSVRDRIADLLWTCGACGQQWPVRTHEERRRGPADRRRASRTDRRHT
jgi:hypothetical protein